MKNIHMSIFYKIVLYVLVLSFIMIAYVYIKYLKHIRSGDTEIQENHTIIGEDNPVKKELAA